jgi:hypothetical protein
VCQSRTHVEEIDLAVELVEEAAGHAEALVQQPDRRDQGRRGLFNEFDGQVDLLDDLDDHYTARQHKRERKMLVTWPSNSLKRPPATPKRLFSSRTGAIRGDVRMFSSTTTTPRASTNASAKC